MIRQRLLIFAVFFSGVKIWAGDCRLKVLTYSSLSGKGSLGEWVQKEWKRTSPECSLDFVPTKEFSGLWGTLKTHAKNKKLAKIDVVWGISDFQYHEAKLQNWLEDGRLFDYSPFAIIFNRKKFPEKAKINSWVELEKSFGKNLLIQDPHTSNTGLGWLRALFEFNVINAKSSSKIVKKVFPSWSSSYEAFLNGVGEAVWTYLTSLAYHRCEDKSEDYEVLKLREGYPLHSEWAAASVQSPNKAKAHQFLSFLSSKTVQQEIPKMNWMFPADSSTSLPGCYVKSDEVKTLQSTKGLSMKSLEKWMERWSLL